MTPFWLQWASPVALIIGAIFITFQITSWRTHPALITWMFVAACINVYALAGGYPWAQWIVSPQMVVWACAFLEVARFNRVLRSSRARATVFGIAVTCAIVRLLLPTHHARQLFRSYYLLALAASFVALAVYRWRHPITDKVVSIAAGRATRHAQCRRHKAYLIGATAWIVTMAATGSFVPGGLGYVLLPFTEYRRDLIGLLASIAIPAIVVAMSAAMGWPVVRRKVAAKTGDAWIGTRKAA